MHPIVSTVTIIAGVANGIALSQSIVPAGGGPLTLNGSLVTAGVATFDAPRRVIVVSGGNDSGITFTIKGTSRVEQGSIAQSETITGSDGGTAVSTQDFGMVTSIVASGATASTVTAGTNGTASGPWVPWDTYQSTFQVSTVGWITSGNPTWGVDYTYDDVFGTWLPPGTPYPRSIALSSGITTSGVDNLITTPVRASRLTLSAYGGVQLTQQQEGI